jgi:hypothetical protein
VRTAVSRSLPPAREQGETPGWRRVSAWLCVGATIVVVVVGGVWPDEVARGVRRVLGEATLARLLVAMAFLAVVVVVGQRLRPVRGAGARVERTARGVLEAVPWPQALLLICVSAGVVWYALGRARVLPRTFSDELLHERVARGVAESGSLAAHGYGLVSGIVDAFGFWLTGDGASAFHLIQLLNVIVMLSAALPAYFLARRVISHGAALVVGALTVSVPWMTYSDMITTEAAFYPVFLVFVLALVRALEHPSWGRQAALLGALVLAFETRTQAVCLVGAIVLAVAIYGWSRRRTVSALRAFAPTWIAFCVAALAVVVGTAAGVVSPLGAYQKLLDDSLSVLHPHGLLLWTAANVTSIGLGTGVLATIAFPLGLAALLRRGSGASEAAFASASTAVSLAILATVVVLCQSRYGTGTVGERNLFYVVPLIFTGALAWAERGFPRPVRLTVVVLTAAIVLAVLMPPGSIAVVVDSHTFGLWTQLDRSWFPQARQMIAAVAVGALVIARLRRTWPIVIAALLTAVGVTAANDKPPMQSRSVATRYGWVDRNLPAGAKATVLYLAAPGQVACEVSPRMGEVAAMAVYTEIFNRRVGTVLQALGTNPVSTVRSPSVTVGPGGVVTAKGKVLRPGYVVLDSRIPIVGVRLALLRARDVIVPPVGNAALALWRTRGVLRLRRPAQIQTTSGLRDLGCA